MSKQPNPFTIGRREFVASSLVFVSGCASSASHQLLRPPASPRSTIVLVHGAWHGGWCWRDVRSRLALQGFRVLTPTLTGLGDRGHLLTAQVGLKTHIDDIVNTVEAEELTNVCLVGHSYGGMVITGAAARLNDRLSSIVYLDAAVPTLGQSMLTEGPSLSAQKIDAKRQTLAEMAPDGVGLLPPPPTLFGIPSSDQKAIDWVARRLTPHPLSTWIDPIDEVGPTSADVRKLFVYCNAPALPNTSFGWHYDRLRSNPSWETTTIATGHDAMVTAPEETSRVIAAFAAA